MKNFFAFIVFYFILIMAFADAGQQLPGPHIPLQALGQPLGNLDPGKHLHLAVELPLRNKAVRDKFLQDLYDPKSPDFHHYLTPAEFTEEFGPNQSDYQVVVSFFKRQGFLVRTSPSRTLLDIDGSVQLIEEVFHTTLKRYQRPDGSGEFYAADKAPFIDLDIPLVGVVGLDDFARIRPMSIAHFKVQS